HRLREVWVALCVADSYHCGYGEWECTDPRALDRSPFARGEHNGETGPLGDLLGAMSSRARAGLHGHGLGSQLVSRAFDARGAPNCEDTCDRSGDRDATLVGRG